MSHAKVAIELGLDYIQITVQPVNREFFFIRYPDIIMSVKRNLEALG